MNTTYSHKIRRLSLGATACLLLVLALAMLGWQQHRLAQSRQRIESLQTENGQLPRLREELARLRRLEVDQANLERLRQEQITNQLEVVKLRAQVTAANRAEAENNRQRTELERQSTPGTTNAIATPMAEMMKGSLKQTFQRRLTRMQEKVNLSQTQTQAIQDILTRQTHRVVEAMQGIYSGKVNRQKLAELRGQDGNPEEKIRALLTPEQQTAYAAMKDEDAINNARLAANGELIQMQNQLGLASGQQDKVYAVLYEQLLTQFKEEDAGNGAANPTEMMQAMHARRLQALEGILTPNQLEGYRQQQERQVQFMNKIMEQASHP